MSYGKHGVMLCDICGETAIKPPGATVDEVKPAGWERLFYANQHELPEHACSAPCTLRGREKDRAVQARSRS